MNYRFAVGLTARTGSIAERVYELLAEGGAVSIEMEKTPFANRFAMLRDRFGTSWMLLHHSCLRMFRTWWRIARQ